MIKVTLYNIKLILLTLIFIIPCHVLAGDSLDDSKKIKEPPPLPSNLFKKPPKISIIKKKNANSSKTISKANFVDELQEKLKIRGKQLKQLEEVKPQPSHDPLILSLQNVINEKSELINNPSTSRLENEDSLASGDHSWDSSDSYIPRGNIGVRSGSIGDVPAISIYSKQNAYTTNSSNYPEFDSLRSIQRVKKNSNINQAGEIDKSEINTIIKDSIRSRRLAMNGYISSDINTSNTINDSDIEDVYAIDTRRGSGINSINMKVDDINSLDGSENIKNIVDDTNSALSLQSDKDNTDAIDTLVNQPINTIDIQDVDMSESLSKQYQTNSSENIIARENYLDNKNDTITSNNGQALEVEQLTPTTDSIVKDDTITSIVNETTSMENTTNQKSTFVGLGDTYEVIHQTKLDLVDIDSHVLLSVDQLKASKEAVMSTVLLSHRMIKDRLFDVYLQPVIIAAGDNISLNTGIWTSAEYSTIKQSKSLNNISYHGKIISATLGGDMIVGENTILGIAYSNDISKLKFNNLSGLSKIKSHILNLYLQYQFKNNLYFQLLGSTSSSFIKSRLQGWNYGRSYTDNAILEGNFIYCNIHDNGVQILPSVGLRYSYLRGGLHKLNSNLGNIVKIHYNRTKMLSSVLGVRILLHPITFSNHLQLIPILKGNIEKKILSVCSVVNNNATTNNSEGVLTNVNIEIPNKIGSNVGFGIIAQYKNTKLQLGYNCNIKSHYKAHTGSIKFKINL